MDAMDLDEEKVSFELYRRLTDTIPVDPHASLRNLGRLKLESERPQRGRPTRRLFPLKVKVEAAIIRYGRFTT